MTDSDPVRAAVPGMGRIRREISGRDLGELAAPGRSGVTGTTDLEAVLWVAGLVHPDTALGVAGARRLHKRALRGDARLVGAGWNPGSPLDVLYVVWGARCIRIDRVSAQRVARVREWGPSVHVERGIGLALEQSSDTNSNPLDESVALIGDALHIADVRRVVYRPVGRHRIRRGEDQGGRARSSSLARPDARRLGQNALAACYLSRW